MSYRNIGSRWFATTSILCLIAACSQHGSEAQAATEAAPAAPLAQIEARAAATPMVTGLPDFSGLVQQVGPAVVNVQVTSRARAAEAFGGDEGADNGDQGDNSDDPFGDFFRRFGIPRGRVPAPRDNTPVRGEGSGFIVSGDGYILTNAHVVDNATKVTVKLTDRREFDAKVVGSDESSDVAVIKIDAKNLPTVRLGDPARLKPGQWVVAIGSPFGFENSVTAGVVSGMARDVGGGDRRYVNFIQTDVAVNPGNSGGPLFNLYGEVVGINSQIYSNTGSYAGLSFAIPIDVAVGVRDQLIKHGHVSRGRIGVGIQEVTAALAQSYGLDRPHGALIGSVETGGPADKAGIKVEDVILAVNGRKVEHSNEVPLLIGAVHPGEKVELELWRDKASRRISVMVEELKDAKQVARAGGGRSDNGGAIGKLGLTVRELNGQERQQLRTNGSVVVVSAEGAAAEAGLRSGDVILRANRAPVNSADDLRNAVKSLTGSVPLVVERQGQQQIVSVDIE